MSNNYIEAMEALRLSLGLSAEAFYLTLLQTPLGDRLNYVRSLSEDREFRRLFAFTVGKLR